MLELIEKHIKYTTESTEAQRKTVKRITTFLINYRQHYEVGYWRRLPKTHEP